MLAIKEWNTNGVKCENLQQEKCSELLMFPVLSAFWCDEGITGHNIIRAQGRAGEGGSGDFSLPPISRKKNKDLLRDLQPPPPPSPNLEKCSAVPGANGKEHRVLALKDF